LARTLTGVDLSANMLQKAQVRGLYSRLVQAEALEGMQAEPAASFDLIVSADVFIYIGRLDTVVSEAARLLRAGGLFAFSVEALQSPATGEEYRLGPTGRYTQSAAYLSRLATTGGFEECERRDTRIRLEQAQPVPGWLVLWRKA
jgi:predicted TPR repeat methyltransferase